MVSCLCKHPLGQKIEIKNTDAGTTILMVPKPDISEENLIVSAHKKGVKLSYIKNALEQENPKVPLKTFILGFGELSNTRNRGGRKTADGHMDAAPKRFFITQTIFELTS